jgi:hypothetical protein
MQAMGTEEPTPEPASEHNEQGEQQDDDETRRKFRELLDRKRERDHLGGTTPAATKHPHAAPAKRGRTFRRKSG